MFAVYQTFKQIFKKITFSKPRYFSRLPVVHMYYRLKYT